MEMKKNTSIVINGGNKIHGQVQVPGDKISAVHLLFASLISNKETQIENMHFCDDVIAIINWVQNNNIATIKSSIKSLSVKPNNSDFNMTLISKSRASICLISAATLKFGKTEIGSSIGGCCFTNRLIDRHLDLIKAFGISLSNSRNEYVATKIKTINAINFDYSTKFGPSVGVTAHALITALVFKGELILNNIALEPVIGVLISFLRKTTGRKVMLENRMVKISAMKKLNHSQSTILLAHDTTIALTYISMAMATNGTVHLYGVNTLLASVNELLGKMGVQYKFTKNGLHVYPSKIIHPKLIECSPWPGIPSDTGPIIVSGLCRHTGRTELIDKIYDSRSTHVNGLNKMGYCLTTNGQSIIVTGQNPHNTSATVKAIDIRAGAALLIGASARLAKTEIAEAHQIFRGYQNIIEDLKNLNIDIKIGEL